MFIEERSVLLQNPQKRKSLGLRLPVIKNPQLQRQIKRQMRSACKGYLKTFDGKAKWIICSNVKS